MSEFKKWYVADVATYESGEHWYHVQEEGEYPRILCQGGHPEWLEEVARDHNELAALRAVLASAQELLHYGSYQRDDGLIDTEGRHFQALRTAVQEAQAQSQGAKGENNGMD